MAYRTSYSINEHNYILHYIKHHRGYDQLKGNKFWKGMEADYGANLPNRTWQSLKEHFRRAMYPKLNLFRLKKVEMQRIRSGYNGEAIDSFSSSESDSDQLYCTSKHYRDDLINKDSLPSTSRAHHDNHQLESTSAPNPETVQINEELDSSSSAVYCDNFIDNEPILSTSQSDKCKNNNEPKSILRTEYSDKVLDNNPVPSTSALNSGITIISKEAAESTNKPSCDALRINDKVLPKVKRMKASCKGAQSVCNSAIVETAANPKVVVISNVVVVTKLATNPTTPAVNMADYVPFDVSEEVYQAMLRIQRINPQIDFLDAKP